MQARPLSKNVDFAEMMLGAMRRSKVDWDDPNIFPASGSPEKSVDALVSVLLC